MVKNEIVSRGCGCKKKKPTVIARPTPTVTTPKK